MAPKKKTPAKKRAPRKRTSKTGPTKFSPGDMTRQQLRVLELHLDGRTLREIEQAMEAEGDPIALTTVRKRLDDAISRHEAHADYERIRAEQLAQCRHIMRKLRRLLGD